MRKSVFSGKIKRIVKIMAELCAFSELHERFHFVRIFAGAWYIHIGKGGDPC